MLFVRDVRSFTGGHLKLRDYICHTATSGWVTPRLYMTPASAALAPEDDIFAALDCARLSQPRPADSYFVAGEDWRILDQAGIAPGSQPVINLVQGVRHADPQTALFGYLSRPALRLCVSTAVAAAIRPFANGPIHVLPTAVDLPERADLPPLPCDVFISGFKAPDLAHQVAECLPAGLTVDLVCEHLPRPRFLQRLSSAKLAVLLPLEREGFFLPPLEAMQLDCPVVTTDCLGVRDYCHSGVNCLIVPRTAQDIAAAAAALLHAPALRQQLTAAGRATATTRTLAAERAAYLMILRAHLESCGALPQGAGH